MSKEERQELKDLLEIYTAKQELQHEKFSEELKEIKDKLEPIAEVYGYFKGFGSLSLGVMKYIIIPLSVVIGLYITIKNNFFK